MVIQQWIHKIVIQQRERYFYDVICVENSVIHVIKKKKLLAFSMIN